MRVVSSRLELDVWPLDIGARSLPRVRTIASTTEDLFAPDISDLRPRNVSKMNTLKWITIVEKNAVMNNWYNFERLRTVISSLPRINQVF